MKKTTWKSRTVWMSAGLMMVVACSGCASDSGGFRSLWGKTSSGMTASAPPSQVASISATESQNAQQNGTSQLRPPYAAAPGSVNGGLYVGSPASTYGAGGAWSNNAGTSGSVAAPAPQINSAPTALNRTALQSQPTSANQFGGQRTCPVTGQALGSMGTPVPVTYNGKTIYLCCEACVAKFQSNPSIYADIAELETNPTRRFASTNSPSYSSSGSGCTSGCCSRR